MGYTYVAAPIDRRTPESDDVLSNVLFTLHAAGVQTFSPRHAWHADGKGFVELINQSALDYSDRVVAVLMGETVGVPREIERALMQGKQVWAWVDEEWTRQMPSHHVNFKRFFDMHELRELIGDSLPSHADVDRAREVYARSANRGGKSLGPTWTKKQWDKLPVDDYKPITETPVHWPTRGLIDPDKETPMGAVIYRDNKTGELTDHAGKPIVPHSDTTIKWGERSSEMAGTMPLGQLLQVQFAPDPHTERLPLPRQAKDGDIGLDLSVSERCIILPGQWTAVPAGISIAPPADIAFLIHGRSSSLKRGLQVMPSIIDSGYRGPIFAMTLNIGSSAVHVARGERIAQLIPLKISKLEAVEVTKLPESERGATGFGSTGI